ncbi:MAG: AIR synthase family protein [Thaumarchaeota archaeon]|nr:AIR synthase family protein [Nitrososphaerota archaeon]
MARKGLGKVDRDFLGRVLFRNTGAENAAVVVGPGMGLDNAVLSVGAGRVMVVTADPLSMIPSIGMDDSAWLTVHELASDLASSAVAPQFAVLDYNLPPSLGLDDFERYAVAVSDECRRLGVSIVGGHTGRYPGSDYTIVGGGMMIALADEGAYVTPKMIQEGDEIVMTKGAAIEATAVLALAFPETTEKKVGRRAARRAATYLRRCSTVEDALAASSVGVRSEGVTAMHDATEGGVLGGLYELAKTSGRTLRIEREKIHVSEESSSVCGAFGLDPLVTISEGTLLIACRPDRLLQVLDHLAAKKIEGFGIGRVQGRGPKLLVSEGASTRTYVPPKFDPYWEVYAAGVKGGWR